VPYGTDSRLNLFQAINCLATIIVSLRDNHRLQVKQRTTSFQLVGKSFEFKPSLFFAKEWRRRADYPNFRQQPRGRSS
jgi:hypothetical protein